MASVLEQARLRLSDPRDRALTTDIVTGVLRWRGTLDHLIAVYAKRPVDRLDPEILDVLRLSIYQLLHLTRVPAAAIVDDAVNLAGRARKASARGFVNAVLRAISRQRHALPLPPRPADPHDREGALAYLTVTLSHPRWLAERWLERFGFADAEAWMQFNNAAPPLTLRANRFRTTTEALQSALAARGMEAARGRFAPDCLRVERGDRTQADGLAALHGLFVVQDEASQLVTLLAGSDPGHRVLDTCASPGGKTTALAAAMADQAAARAGASDGADAIIACDVRGRRIDLLKQTIALTGARHVHVVQADLLAPLPFHPVFDCVFVDAPCSGLGTVRRDPDIKWWRRPEELATLATAQRLMLAHAAAMVRPGGRLIYATCSSEPEENENVTQAFLDTRDGPGCDFIPVDARRVHPALSQT
ncbi:MAG: transcription antitermination factor NusB, partial [Vicinamibacterales bacterium]